MVIGGWFDAAVIGVVLAGLVVTVWIGGRDREAS